MGEKWENERARKLLDKGKPFVVVAIDEPYFATVYQLIRAREREIGRWTAEDERGMEALLAEWERIFGQRLSPTVKGGWKLSIKRCSHCNHLMQPVAYLDDGWFLVFECRECDTEDCEEIEWPFETDRANWRDLGMLGFIVV